MNRQTVADGHTLEYDRNGNRIKDTSAGSVETYDYDALNRLWLTKRNDALVEERDYDAAHRVVRTTTPAGIRTNTYDANGRLKHQDIVEPGSNWSGINYDYDDVGNLKSTLVADLVSQTFSGSTNTYEQGEGYRLKSTTNVLQNLGELIYNYDANGHLASTNNVYELNSANRDHLFINDAAGNVLHTYYLDSATHQGVNAQRQLVVNGEVLGRYGEVATSRVPFPGYPNWTLVNYEAQADFSFGAQGINSQYPAGTPASRVVQDGDTLRGIAQTTYGNAALWYVIAEANGLSSDADLVSGQVLKLPPVVDSANNADTFRPYDPSRIADDTPTALPVPQGSGGGCGGVGTIIVAVVAVVVTIYTAGLASGASGAFMATMQAGATTLAGAGAASGAALVATAAGSAAVGSIVSQGVGIAIGAQDSFSWKQVGLAAVGGGVAGGLAGAGVLPTTSSAFVNGAIRGAVGSALTQGIAVATGLQSSFSWRSVAASAVSGGAAQGLNAAMGYNPAVDGFNLGKSLVTGIGGSVIGQAVRGGKVSATTLATDAFGVAIGSSLAAANSSGDVLGDFIRKNDNWAGVSAAPTFAEGRAARDLARNPMGLPTSSAAQLFSDQGWAPSGGYGYQGSVDGITTWQNIQSDASGRDFSLSGMVTLRDGSIISDAENLDRISRTRGTVYATNGLRDQSGPVIADAGGAGNPGVAGSYIGDKWDAKVQMGADAIAQANAAKDLQKAAQYFGQKAIEAYQSGDTATGDANLQYARDYSISNGNAQASASALNAATPKYVLPLSQSGGESHVTLADFVSDKGVTLQVGWGGNAGAVALGGYGELGVAFGISNAGFTFNTYDIKGVVIGPQQGGSMGLVGSIGQGMPSIGSTKYYGVTGFGGAGLVGNVTLLTDSDRNMGLGRASARIAVGEAFGSGAIRLTQTNNQIYQIWKSTK